MNGHLYIIILFVHLANFHLQNWFTLHFHYWRWKFARWTIGILMYECPLLYNWKWMKINENDWKYMKWKFRVCERMDIHTLLYFSFSLQTLFTYSFALLMMKVCKMNERYNNVWMSIRSQTLNFHFIYFHSFSLIFIHCH